MYRLLRPTYGDRPLLKNTEQLYNGSFGTSRDVYRKTKKQEDKRIRSKKGKKSGRYGFAACPSITPHWRNPKREMSNHPRMKTMTGLLREGREMRVSGLDIALRTYGSLLYGNILFVELELIYYCSGHQLGPLDPLRGLKYVFSK
jgi:hypothetical protein